MPHSVRPSLAALVLAFAAVVPVLAQPAPRPLARDANFRRPLVLTEHLRIGSSDGEHDAFGRVSHAAFGPSGRIFVADDMNHRVAVFDARGKWLRDLGRRGQGPGEMESPWLVAVDGRDSAFVWDMALARVSVFGPDLAFRRSFQVPPQWGVNAIEFLADGTLLLAAYSRGERSSLHVLDRAGRRLRGFGPTFPATDLGGFESSLLGGSIDVADGVIAYSKKSPYEVTFFDAAGRPRGACRGDAGLTTQPASVVVRDRNGAGLRWNRYAHSASLVALGNGMFLNEIRDPVNDRRVLDVITADCRLLRRRELKVPLTITHRSGARLLGVRNLEYPEVVVLGFSLGS